MKPTRHSREMMDRYMREEYWGRPSIAELWDRNAKNHPDKDAVADSRTRMTWSQAKRWIDRVSLGLLALGIRKDEIIVTQLPNRVETMLLPHALVKAGILGLPALMTLRHHEMTHILAHTEAVGIVLMTAYRQFDYYRMVRDIRPQLPKLKYIFVLDDPAPEGALSVNQLSREPLDEKYPADYLKKTSFGPLDVILLKMTSGTSGFPKFVERPNNLSFIGPVNMVRWKMTPEDVCAAFAPVIGGACSILCCYTAPHLANKVVLLEKFEPQDALKIIAQEKVTVASGVPAQMVRMLRHPDFHRYDLSSLRAFFYAGASCPQSLAEELEEKMGCRIINDLGSIDGGNISSTCFDDPPEVRHRSVGKIYPGMEVKLLDEAGKEVLPGETGQIVSRGAVAPSGYFRDPETTRQVWGDEDDGWFHTGDLGRFDDQGNLYIVGRKKDMIIRGGQNIIPGEIEDMLLTHPKVFSAAVVAMPDPVMGEKACAYVIPKPGREFTFDEMIDFLKGKNIAPYKLPERLEIVDEFPMSGDGQKVMKKALSEDVSRKLKAEIEGRVVSAHP